MGIYIKKKHFPFLSRYKVTHFILLMPQGYTWEYFKLNGHTDKEKETIMCNLCWTKNQKNHETQFILPAPSHLKKKRGGRNKRSPWGKMNGWAQLRPKEVMQHNQHRKSSKEI